MNFLRLVTVGVNILIISHSWKFAKRLLKMGYESL